LETSISIALGFLLTFAYWGEGLETSHRLGDHVKLQALDPSATLVFSAALLQTVLRLGSSHARQGRLQSLIVCVFFGYSFSRNSEGTVPLYPRIIALPSNPDTSLLIIHLKQNRQRKEGGSDVLCFKNNLLTLLPFTKAFVIASIHLLLFIGNREESCLYNLSLWVDHVKEIELTGVAGGAPASCWEVFCSDFDPVTA